jgi:hypothetical protein
MVTYLHIRYDIEGLTLVISYFTEGSVIVRKHDRNRTEYRVRSTEYGEEADTNGHEEM